MSARCERFTGLVGELRDAVTAGGNAARGPNKPRVTAFELEVVASGVGRSSLIKGPRMDKSSGQPAFSRGRMT